MWKILRSIYVEKRSSCRLMSLQNKPRRLEGLFLRFFYNFSGLFHLKLFYFHAQRKLRSNYVERLKMFERYQYQKRWNLI